MTSQTIPSPATVRQASPFPDPIPGIIPHGSLVLLVGPPKSGKTALVASCLQRWRDGQTICGLPTHAPTGLGMITTDHKWALNQGIWMARAGFPEIPHISLRDDLSVKWRDDFRTAHGSDDLLKRCLDKLKLPAGGLVVLDVIGPFITNRLNDYNAVLGGMGSVGRILDERDLTGLGLGHMGKQRADPKERYLRPHERILGSGAQIGFSDTTMYLLGPEDIGEAYHLFGWLPTHQRAGEFKFVQNTEGLFVPYQDANAPTAVPPPQPGVSPHTLDLVLACLTPDPQARHVIVALAAAAYSVSSAGVDRALKELCRLGKALKDDYGTYRRTTPS